MHFTDAMQEIVGNAFWLSLEGKGQVLTDEAIPDAHRLAEAGWLERRSEPNGDTSWWWSGAGDTVLGLSGLMRGAEGREN
jgi:hypothetical protein